MADEIITELWKIKDDLSREFGGDLKAYCEYLNRTVSTEGFEVVDRTHPEVLKVAEEELDYKTGKE